MSKWVLSLILLSAASVASAGSVYWDAAAWDWTGTNLTFQQALVVMDNRGCDEPTYFGEISFPDQRWADMPIAALGRSPAGSPWADVIELPAWSFQVGDIIWSWGYMTFTPTSRDCPTIQCMTMWRSVAEDEWGMPLAEGELPGYVPPDTYFVIAAITSGAFFHSPAEVDVAGSTYSDASMAPDFTGLPSIPEPATMCLLALGGLALMRRRR